MERVGDYLSYMISKGARFVTASDLTEMQIRRGRDIEPSDVREMAACFAEGSISFYDIGGEYVSPSEAFLLIAESLGGKPLTTFLLYGPESREQSVFGPEDTVSSEQVVRAMSEFDRIGGYPQLRSLYSVGNTKLTPTDLCCTAAFMLSNGVRTCHPVHGTLACEQYVRGSSDWSGRWLFGRPFHVPNTYEKTRLQCWTLKPVRF